MVTICLTSNQGRSCTWNLNRERDEKLDGDGHTLSMTIGTKEPIGLAPGKSLTISYPLIAPDPSPETKQLLDQHAVNSVLKDLDLFAPVM